MIRKIIKIDAEKCNGCTLCAKACHEGAIGMVNGKATLLRDDYCDGLGDCLPVCPTGAISFEERDAAEYDEAAVKARMAAPQQTPTGVPGHECEKQDGEKAATQEPLACGCPGTHVHKIERENTPAAKTDCSSFTPQSQLNQWPVQIKLAPVNAPYFENANLLIAADCTAYAYANFHADFMKNKITLIGCPKLDDENYAGKLTEILTHNNIKTITVLRMEVPCCGGIENAVKTALQNSQKMIPWQVVTISTNGEILEI